MHPNVVENRLETRDPDPKGGLESLVSNTSCVVLAELLSLSVLESPTGVSDNNSTNAVITSPRNMVFTGCWWYARHQAEVSRIHHVTYFINKPVI